MPPKAQRAAEAQATSRSALAGRVGTGLKVGIVGLPNAGKSTLFNAITTSQVAMGPHPFCTIEPHEARAVVPDPRFDWLVSHWTPERAIPSFLHVTDIAGLVRDASKGEGLGNAFLANIKAMDALFHLVRAFDDPDVAHVEDTIDPVRDLGLVDQELIAKDTEWLEQILEKSRPHAERMGSIKGRQLKEEIGFMEKAIAALQRGVPLRCETWTAKEAEYISSLLLLSAKPMVYLVNLSQQDYIRKRSRWLPRVKEYVDAHSGEMIVPLSADMELTLCEMESKEEREGFLTQHNVITAGYKALKLMHFFTHVPTADEVRCWTVQEGTLAPQAGGKVHSDFETHFVCAEVTPYEDMKEAKAQGKMRQQGRTYVVKDGDIITFKCGKR